MLYSGLREPQLNAVSGLRSEWKRHSAIMLNAPCGFGKTYTASYLCKQLADAGKNVVFAAPYVTLVDQTFKRFQQYGHDDLSVIWRNDARYRPSARIQIASADTLSRRDWPKPDVLIWDEAHIARRYLLELMEGEEFKTIGLSATPFAPWLGKYYKGFVKPCTTQQMIDIGLLTPFEIMAPTLPDLDGVKLRKNSFGEMDFCEETAAAIMGDAKIVGDILATWLEHGEGLPTIGFAPNIATANAYAMEFRRAGVPVAVITQDTDPFRERPEIFRMFDSGEIKVIWNVGVLGAGFDSDVRCVIWAKPTKSETVWVQGTLRGSRPAPGKEHCKLFDHSGTYWRLGCPTQIEHYSLNDGSLEEAERRKKATEEREKKAAECKCPKCGRIKRPDERQCAQCGHLPIGRGDITVNVDESRGLHSVNNKKSGPSREEMQNFYSQLLGHRKKSGEPMDPKRAAGIFKQKFGEWPNGFSKRQEPCGPEVSSYIKSTQIRYAKGRAKA